MTTSQENPRWLTRQNEWFHAQHFPPIDFYAELWRNPEDEPNLAALELKYGRAQAVREAERIQGFLLDEVVTAATGLLHTLEKIEALMAALQSYTNENVAPWPEEAPWPELGQTLSHPLVVEASFEFVNFLGWLRAIDERLDRRHQPGQPHRVGLIPSLADRPLRAKAKTLVQEFRSKALDRKLANYVLHEGAVPQPLGGASLSRSNEVALKVPDRPAQAVATRWHLTYNDERDALTVARETGQAIEALVDGLIAAFAEESRAIEADRKRKQGQM